MKDRERIVCAAIWYNDGKEWPHQPVNIKTGIVVCGLRHSNCFASLSLLYKSAGGYDDELRIHILRNEEQGFITTHHRFLNREEAGKLAIEAGQIAELKYLNNELDSSDLY